MLWRSSDQGLTWGPRTFRSDLCGREWSLNVLADGTILAPNALLSADRNFNGTYAWIHRSTDHGQTFIHEPIGGTGCDYDWSVYEHGGAAFFGITKSNAAKQPTSHGAVHSELWRSTDSGVSWDKSLRPTTQGWPLFFSQSTTHRAPDGSLQHVVRTCG